MLLYLGERDIGIDGFEGGGLMLRVLKWSARTEPPARMRTTERVKGPNMMDGSFVSC